jgi:hypothetical protein
MDAMDQPHATVTEVEEHCILVRVTIGPITLPEVRLRKNRPSA